MSVKSNFILGAAIAVTVSWAGAASANNGPKGIWYDHNGRGAIEINDCENGRGLCGYVVHVKDQKRASRCGTQILGNVTPNGGGWIYSPSRGRKYAVRINNTSSNRLRVVGNANSRFFSKTFTWNRAPENIELCGKYAKRNEAKTDVAAVKPQPIAKPVAKPAAKPAPVQTEQPRATQAATTETRKPVVKTNVEAPRPTNEYPRKEEQVSQPAETATNTDQAYTQETEASDELAFNTGYGSGRLERKCKFRIPYVGRVVMVPCRDKR